MRPKVVLYNPASVFYTMPLALVALASRLGRADVDVRVVDARLEPDPTGRVLQEMEGALCLGVTVLTGAPLRDALQVTRAARERHPGVPVVWGGWHPSLFPAETLAEAGIQALVVGQGEDACADIVARLQEGAGLAGIPGVHAAGAPPGPFRPMRDINELPAHDYDHLPVERYFALKGRRQLDYISSQGCRFRCAFCADPTVFKRGWYGLEPARMGAELEALWRRHHFHDLSFQDETFFTSTRRVGEIADQILSRELRFSWAATMRADQGQRLDDAVLGACRAAGLRSVMIGVESGAPSMLKRIRKDITLDQVFASAEKCLRHGVAATFNIIVGFPGETEEELTASLEVGKRLRAMSPRFELAIFHYKPYPGNPLAETLRAEGHAFPATLQEWADFDYVATPSPWMRAADRTRVERFRFYQRIGWARATRLRAPVQALARWRCRRNAYALPVEKLVIERLRPPPTLA